MIALRYLSSILIVRASPHSSTHDYCFYHIGKQFVQKASKQFLLNSNQIISLIYLPAYCTQTARVAKICGLRKR